MRVFSEQELILEPRWFTGKEWADGTAERECRREYKERSKMLAAMLKKQEDREHDLR